MKAYLRKAQRRHQRIKRFRTYREVSRVLVLFNIENLDEAQALVKLLEKDGKQVKAFSLDKRKVDYSFLPHAFSIWDKSDLTAFSVPLKEKLAEVEDFKADTLIDMSIRPLTWQALLHCYTTADYRVGFSCQDSAHFDLLLTTGQDKSLAFFLDQLLFYLKSIRTS